MALVAADGSFPTHSRFRDRPPSVKRRASTREPPETQVREAVAQGRPCFAHPAFRVFAALVRVTSSTGLPRKHKSPALPFYQAVGAGLPNGVFDLMRCKLLAQISFQQARQILERGIAVQPLKESAQFGTADPDWAMVQGCELVQALTQLPSRKAADPGPVRRCPGHWKGRGLEGDKLCLDQFQQRLTAWFREAHRGERAGIWVALGDRGQGCGEGGVCRTDFVIAGDKSEDTRLMGGRRLEACFREEVQQSQGGRR